MRAFYSQRAEQTQCSKTAMQACVVCVCVCASMPTSVLACMHSPICTCESVCICTCMWAGMSVPDVFKDKGGDPPLTGSWLLRSQRSPSPQAEFCLPGAEASGSVTRAWLLLAAAWDGGCRR